MAKENKIRTIPLKNTTYFSEKDILEAFNLTQTKAYKNVKSFVNVEVAPVPTKVGNATIRVKSRVIPVATVEAIAKANNIQWAVAGGKAVGSTGCCGAVGCKTEEPPKAFKKLGSATAGSGALSSYLGAKSSSKEQAEINRLTKEVSDLKTLVAQLLTKEDSNKKSLHLSGKNVSLKHDRLQPEARRKIRDVVENYADKRSRELGITDPSKKSIFYDLSYKALYNEYKRQTPNHIDLKDLADKQTNSGNKISALQVAEQLGVAVELLNLAKTLFGSQSK